MFALWTLARCSRLRRFPRGVAAVVCWMLVVWHGSVSGDEPSLTIQGDTLDVWRARMSELNLSDPASAQYTPGLIEIVRIPDIPWFTRRQAALTLGRLGSLAVEGVPVLIQQLQTALDQADRETALWATKGLGLYGTLAREATPRLVAGFRHPLNDRLLQMSVLDTLSQIGPAHPQAIPYLLRVATDQAGSDLVDDPAQPFSRQDLQQAAIEALGLIGAAASPAVPALVRLLDHPHDSLRREAANALGRMGPAAEIAVPSLLDRLMFDTDPAVQDQAEAALANIGAASAGASLRPLLTSDDPEVLPRVLRILATWKMSARPWQADIVPLVQSNDPQTHLAAMAALLAMNGPQADWGPKIIANFRHPDREIRRQAYLLFEKLGSVACAEQMTLMNFSTDPDPAVRAIARKALAHCAARDSLPDAER